MEGGREGGSAIYNQRLTCLQPTIDDFFSHEPQPPRLNLQTPRANLRPPSSDRRPPASHIQPRTHDPWARSASSRLRSQPESLSSGKHSPTPAPHRFLLGNAREPRPDVARRRLPLRMPPFIRVQSDALHRGGSNPASNLSVANEKPCAPRSARSCSAHGLPRRTRGWGKESRAPGEPSSAPSQHTAHPGRRFSADHSPAVDLGLPKSLKSRAHLSGFRTPQDVPHLILGSADRGTSPYDLRPCTRSSPAHSLETWTRIEG
jgi:hypothetical protein